MTSNEPDVFDVMTDAREALVIAEKAIVKIDSSYGLPRDVLTRAAVGARKTLAVFSPAMVKAIWEVVEAAQVAPLATPAVAGTAWGQIMEKRLATLAELLKESR